MASRSSRQRKTRQLPEFEYGSDNATKSIATKKPRRGSITESVDNVSASESPAKRTRTNCRADTPIKMEPDDTCVLPTDNIVDARPKKKPPISSKPMSLRNLMAMDILTLEVLQCASTSMLRELFGYLKADELSRQFVYHCQLMPKRCGVTFKSFGNENKAKINIERHLGGHIDELLKESAGKESAERNDGTKTKFTAVSLQAAVRKREKDKAKPKKQDECRVVLEKLSSPLKPLLRGNRNVKKTAQKKSPVKVVAKSGRSKRFNKIAKMASSITSCITATAAATVKSTGANKRGEESGSDIEVDNIEESSVEVIPTASSRSSMLLETQSLISRNTEMMEKIHNQLRLEKQPYRDHCYPILVKGRIRSEDLQPNLPEVKEDKFITKPYSIANRAEWDNMDSDPEDEGIIHHDLACHYNVIGTGASLNTGFVISSKGEKIPVMQLLQIRTAPAVGEEVLIMKSRPKALNPPSVQSGCIVESESDDEGPVTTTLARPYPPMPKYQPELGTKLIIPEEEMNFPENDEDIPEEWDFENKDHVKRFAVRCMRDLKLNRGLGARNCNVSCKICGKEFTATATLMYHYRSHADIKPFVCLLCNSTFTRQHSLNYHMLIHNDATRFKCPDCGRAFRHPSHYKEHRRRHTGEQPYHCPKCEMKFKTRNSYKRHISSKHPGSAIRIAMAKADADIKEERALPDSRSVSPTAQTASVSIDLPKATLPPVQVSAAIVLASQRTAVSTAPTASPVPTAISSGTVQLASQPTINGRPVLLKMTDMYDAGSFSTQFTTVKIVNPLNKAGKPGIILPAGALSVNFHPGASSDLSGLVAVPVYTHNSVNSPSVGQIEQTVVGTTKQSDVNTTGPASAIKTVSKRAHAAVSQNKPDSSSNATESCTASAQIPTTIQLL